MKSKLNIRNVTKELKCRRIDASLENIKMLALKRQLVAAEYIEDLTERVTEMVRNGELIKVESRKGLTIYEVANSEDTQTETNETEAKGNFKMEIFNIVNNLYESMENFYDYFNKEIRSLKSQRNPSVKEKDPQISKNQQSKEMSKEIEVLKKENK